MSGCEKPKWDWSNAKTRLLLEFAVVIFAAGGLWAKIGGLESSIDDLVNRVQAMERILMGRL